MSDKEELVPKADYGLPVQQRNKRWEYGFEWMEVGDQMRCPIMAHETRQRAAVRVHSAAISWKTKNKAAERLHIKFRSQQRAGYILIERVA